MNRLNLEHISKSFGTKELINNVSLGISDGDRIGLIGVNGTGKSTLMKIAAGLMEPDGGQVVKARDLTISFLPQMPEFPGDKTALDAVMHGRKPGSSEEAEAKSMLNQLGVTDHGAELETLSGGQRKRVALARTLLSQAELLILDEPTNHLDQAMIMWLEDYLKGFRGELLLITHDRYFLDRVTNRTVELDHGTLYSYDGGYELYLQRKAERLETDRSAATKRENILRTELKWIQRGAQARTTKQQARIGRFEDLRKEQQEARHRLEENSKSMSMSSVSTRLGKKTLELTHISKSYGGKTLIDDFSYIFLRDDRIGFIGQNGCGKSTLMNIIAGAIQPDSGTVTVGETVKIGYFRQESELPDGDETVLGFIKNIGEYVRTTDGLITASQMCEKFLFDTKMQWAKCATLSGGEKRRLYLLSVLMSQPNVLILDEPTNDLDITTLEIFEDYLDHFLGIVITVSHDRYFLDRIVNRIFAFEPGGKIRQYEGGYTDYYEKKKAEEAGTAGGGLGSGRGQTGFGKGAGNGAQGAGSAAATGQSGTDIAGSTADDLSALSGREKYEAEKAASKASKKLRMSYKEQREYETIDADIDALEQKVAELDEQMAAAATDYGKLAELSAEKEKVQAELNEKEERWLYLSELAEEIEAQEK